MTTQLGYQPWMYRGNTIRISGTASMPRNLRPRGRDAHLVQRLLDGMPPWEKGDDPIETLDFDDTKLLAPTVPLGAGSVIWAVHIGHKARRPQLSPFVKVADVVLISSLTVELYDSPASPAITRIYAGDYMPPLPWQNSASRALGSREACRKYWRENGYVYNQRLVVPGTETTRNVPNWFTASD